MAQNVYSKLNFLSYQGLMTEIEKANQAPTANVTSHNNDPMTYREMYYVVKTINKEMNSYQLMLQDYQQQLSEGVAVALGTFTELLIKKDIISKEEAHSLIEEIKEEQDKKSNDKHKE